MNRGRDQETTGRRTGSEARHQCNRGSSCRSPQPVSTPLEARCRPEPDRLSGSIREQRQCVFFVGMDPLYVKGLREAKGLLDAGTISAEDFEKEKRKLLSEREERERQEQEQEERRRKRPLEDEAARTESEGKRKSPEESGKGERKAPAQARAPAAADQAAPIPFLFPPPPSKWFAPPVFPMMPPAVHGGKARDGGCMCKSTLCLKLYCRCFRYGVLCTDSCACVECYNDGRHEGERQAALSASPAASRWRTGAAAARKASARKSTASALAAASSARRVARASTASTATDTCPSAAAA
ncbi:MAG: hypothetical protein ACPIOQ_65890 [Promethearchaeia archaeon]